jgi:hypothetical protein
MRGRRVYALGVVPVFLAGLWVQCVGNDNTVPDAAAPGSLGGPCFTNNTCDAGLACVIDQGSAVCAMADGSGDENTPDAAPDAAQGDAAAEAGDAGCDAMDLFNLQALAQYPGCLTCLDNPSNCATQMSACNVECSCRQVFDDFAGCTVQGSITQCASNALATGNQNVIAVFGCMQSQCPASCGGSASDAGAE